MSGAWRFPTRRPDRIVAALLFLAVFPAQEGEWFSLLEDQTLTLRHQLRLAYGETRARLPAPDVTVVTLDEAFFASYRGFPLRRDDIATIVDALNALGARVIGLDLLMDYPSSYGEDPRLAEALARAGNAVLVARASVADGRIGAIVRPTPDLDRAAPSAYTNIQSDSALLTSLSRLRIYPDRVAEPGGWPFAVLVAARYLGVDPRLEGSVLVLGDRRVRLDGANRLPIDFPALPAGTRFLSQSAGIGAAEFLTDPATLDPAVRAELEAWVRGRIVLIGDTSEVSHDWFDTPVGMVYGVEIIADTIQTLLAGGPLRAATPAEAGLIPLGLGLALIGLGSWLARPWPRGLAVAGLGGGFVALACLLYVREGVVVPMSYGLVALVLGHLVIEFRLHQDEHRQKRHIARTFGQYIPPQLVEEINHSGQAIEIGGESREMTVLFSDVRGFTSLSEGLAPQQLALLMNAFLSPMTRVIHDHRGTIDKYMGDAIMAFWGAPLDDPDHARHAVDAAIEMTRRMTGLDADFVARGWPPIRVGVGLNSGVMSVGNMGSDFRMAYTVLGDAVNLGARIESLTRYYGVDLLISEFTRDQVPDLICREIDRVRVKGKAEPVRLFQPFGYPDMVRPPARAWIGRHHAALALYRARRWDEAGAMFAAVLAAPEDQGGGTTGPAGRVAELYLERIDRLRRDPPGPDWDGVHDHQRK